MKKSGLMFLIFLLVGLVAGIIVGELLSEVPALWFLTKSVPLSGHPNLDLKVFTFDLYIKLNLNLCAILGVVAAIWIYRRL